MPPYRPKQGDIIFANFDPRAGHEQAGRRPGVIISNWEYHRHLNGLALVCPITNTNWHFPLHIPLDARTKTTGYIMCEQMKSFDLIARKTEFREVLPNDLLLDVLECFNQCIELD